MKKLYWIIGIVVLLVVVFFVIRGNEDTWIENDTGVYVEHGVPSSTPDYVQEQQIAVSQAMELYNRKRIEGMNFSSQCLGTVGINSTYAVDIVHMPRTQEDDLPENQCSDFRTGKVQHFIEFSKNGEIIKIV